MPVVDFHAHLTPNVYRRAVERGDEWYGLAPGKTDWDPGELHHSGFVMSMEDRVADMDALGVDVQVLSPTAGFYQYDKPAETTSAIARECNEAIAEVIADFPTRFAGLGTLPMQDTPAAVRELERVMRELRFKGVMVNDHVLGRTYNEPAFVPFWEAVESLGAIVLFHQGSDRRYAFNRYYLGNSIGNLVERAVTFGCLAAGGVLDRFPNVRVLLSHAGGFTSFASSRMDKAAGAFGPDAPAANRQPPYQATPGDDYDAPARKPPGDYLGKVYYDCCTFSEGTLRFLIDTVGIDRVVLGTDAPAPMVLTDAVNWINGLHSLSEVEKKAILERNALALGDF